MKLEQLERGSAAWFAVLGAKLPRTEVTDATRETTRREAKRFRGGMRVSTGRFMTDREYEAYRRRVLSTPLR